MNKVIKKVVLPNRPPKNPIPSIVNGGDCGACVLAGVLGITVEEAYELHCSGKYYGGTDIPQQSTFSFHSMVRTLENLVDDLGLHEEHGEPTLLEHVVTDLPLWLVGQHHEISGMSFGVAGSMQFSPWSDYVRAMLSGGYYGICQVFDGGHKTLDGYGLTNHWVMIAGWQYVRVEHKDGGGHYEPEVCIRNSSHANPDEEWMGVDTFLKKWGGFGVLWAKPVTK